MATTSDGLVALLKRKGISSTGDRVKDIKLAKSVMPPSYKEEKNEKHN